MDNIKRILWIDDYPNNKISNMFPAIETKKVSTMDAAIDEIAGPHLYDYDTIVLDIDFENGLPNGEKNVLEKLSKKIFLNEDQKNKNFVIGNGGYLLFLYLLEKGYPSEQVAFLTGNAGIIDQLKTYTKLNLVQMSKQEITANFISAWKDCGNNPAFFQEKIDALPIDVKYKTSDFVLDCAEALYSNELDKLKKLIHGKTPSVATKRDQSPRNKMIFRFHEANLESPVYFSKNDNDIDGHNRKDAEQWLTFRRSEDKVTRWLLLDAANYVEMLFLDNQKAMGAQVRNLFKDEDTDIEIRSAFRQMFLTFDGLRNTERRGIYYQAIFAMLKPFDNKPKNSGVSVNIPNLTYDKVQRMFAFFSKQTRNYCAHNLLGPSLTNHSVLYIIACTLLGILSKKQTLAKVSWFENVNATISNNSPHSVIKNLSKIDNLCQTLLNENKIDTISAKVTNDYSRYSPRDLLVALGYNKEMSISTQPSTGVREKYYIFTLAAYVVKWFDGLSENEVQKKSGLCTSMIYKISNEIVAHYMYPGTI